MDRRDNSGTLRRNEKATTDKHPSHKGACTVGGAEYWISAWINEGDDGRKYFKLSFEQKKRDTFVDDFKQGRLPESVR